MVCDSLPQSGDAARLAMSPLALPWRAMRGVQTGIARSLTDWRGPDRAQVREMLRVPRLERAIGVVYRPESELSTHYFEAVLPEQFDRWMWFEQTSAVTPLGHEKPHGAPETYPFGLWGGQKFSDGRQRFPAQAHRSQRQPCGHAVAPGQGGRLQQNGCPTETAAARDQRATKLAGPAAGRVASSMMRPRFGTFSFSRIMWTWFLTVAGLMLSAPAISLFDRPC